MKKYYTGKENFTQGVISTPSNNNTLVKRQLRYIRDYVFNGGIYPIALKITSRENLLFLLKFIKLRKDLKNILRELKVLKQDIQIDLIKGIFPFKSKASYEIKLAEYRDCRYIYNSLLYKYNYILKSL